VCVCVCVCEGGRELDDMTWKLLRSKNEFVRISRLCVCIYMGADFVPVKMKLNINNLTPKSFDWLYMQSSRDGNAQTTSGMGNDSKYPFYTGPTKLSTYC